MHYLSDNIRIRRVALPGVDAPLYRLESLNGNGTWDAEMVDTNPAPVEEYAHHFARLAMPSI